MKLEYFQKNNFIKKIIFAFLWFYEKPKSDNFKFNNNWQLAIKSHIVNHILNNSFNQWN